MQMNCLLLVTAAAAFAAEPGCAGPGAAPRHEKGVWPAGTASPPPAHEYAVCPTGVRSAAAAIAAGSVAAGSFGSASLPPPCRFTLTEKMPCIAGWAEPERVARNR